MTDILFAVPARGCFPTRTSGRTRTQSAWDVSDWPGKAKTLSGDMPGPALDSNGKLRRRLKAESIKS
ncbi:MAG: hypothetical protein CL569_20525 [Alphaproteobacteria bacterium]|nr:hypothetical protein [Alphaproteobacteria bacterium]